jgi:hypothetical protein
MKPELQALKIAKEHCAQCNVTCKYSLLQAMFNIISEKEVKQFHIKNWTRIREDGVLAKERCADFRHVSSPVEWREKCK